MKTTEQIKQFELAEQEYANSNKSIRELSKAYSIDRSMLYGWFLAKGYNITNRRASKSFNVEYFDSIDTEEKAYWLGFLFADGAITQYNKSYDIELSLKIEDTSHVRKFADAVGKQYIGGRDYRSRCILGSKHMFNTLNSYGCTTRKSLTLKFPDTNIFKSTDLIRHFIRGYVDGDGCLSYKDKEHNSATISILGTEDFLNGIQKQYGSFHKLRLNDPKQPCTQILAYSDKSAYAFAKYLYEGATVYLERKYNRYKDYCRLYEESYKLLSDKIGESCDANTEQTIDITKGSIAA
jgi:hypothetical protein